MTSVDEIAPGVWRWAAPHPQWRAGAFGREVASYALDLGGDGVLLIDPLLPEGLADEILALAGARRPVHVHVTIPYHVRDTAQVVGRLGARRVTVWGERRVARRLEPEGIAVHDPAPGELLAFGARCFAIGRPRRAERPLWVPAHGALCFGDALVVEPGGRLVIWSQDRLDAARRAFYAERFAPTLAPLLDLPVRRILVTHGTPVLRGAPAALRAALEPGGLWYHPG